MKYEEFKKVVENTGEYYVNEDVESVFITEKNHSKWCIRISKNVRAFIEFAFDAYGKNDGDLIRAVLNLAETPLDEREPEKKYYLRHKFIISMYSHLRAYLILNYDVYYLGSPNQYPDHQSTFTKKEIEGIKNKFGVTLSDFEMIEVEE